MGHGNGNRGKHRIVNVLAAQEARTTKKYDYSMGADNWREVWADEATVDRARTTGDPIPVYHDAQKKRLYCHATSGQLRTCRS